MLGKAALVVSSVVGVLALTACSTDSGMEGSGTEASEARNVPPFNAIDVSGLADAVVTVAKRAK